MRSELNEPGTRNFSHLLPRGKIFSIDQLIAKFYLFIRWRIDPTADGGPYSRSLEGLKNWEDAGIKTLVAVIKSQHYSFFR
ncbi:hypothetical protein HmCmsJML039_04201 [Escherichia coli]|nr:hypothetical protein HmCmsJML039_04201 [Escherichia coli]